MTNQQKLPLPNLDRDLSKTLLYRLNASVDKTLATLYNKIMADAELKVFFQNIDMNTLRSHQKIFMFLVFTKQELPTDLNIYQFILERHRPLFKCGLTEHHFDLFVEHLIESFREAGTEEEQLDEVAETLQPYRNYFEAAADEAALESDDNLQMALRNRQTRLIKAKKEAAMGKKRREKAPESHVTVDSTETSESAASQNSWGMLLEKHVAGCGGSMSESDEDETEGKMKGRRSGILSGVLKFSRNSGKQSSSRVSQS